MEDYQKKSQTTDISEADDKPVKLRTKKRGIGQKFKDTFIKGDIEEVTAGIVSEFLIPYILNGVTDMCHSFIDGMFNGEGAGYYSGGYTNYAKRKKKSNGSTSNGGMKRTNGSKKTRQLDDVLFDSQRDAKMVLKLMQEALEDGHHDSVSLTDFYDFYEEVTGDTIAHDSPEARWGWYDLEGVNVLRTRDEDGGIAYYIKLPKAEYLG